MKKLIIICSLAAALLGSCGGSGTARQADDACCDSAARCNMTKLSGKWNFVNIVNDSIHLDRNFIDSIGSDQGIVLGKDSTYSVVTNCNSIGGSYTVTCDSSAFSDGFMTEMACDNMEVEDAVRFILPKLNAYIIESDSTLRLISDDDKCFIVLKKAE